MLLAFHRPHKSNEPKLHERLDLAKHGTESAIAHLVDDPNYEVREAVAHRGFLAHLKILKDDNDPTVSEKAWDQLKHYL